MKYAIVRVDGRFSCPSQYENIKDEFVCRDGCRRPQSCEKALYGDTKEQLIKKVAQVIYKQQLKNWAMVMLLRIEDISEYTKTSFQEQATELAKEIVEFLGVEK